MNSFRILIVALFAFQSSGCIYGIVVPPKIRFHLEILSNPDDRTPKNLIVHPPVFKAMPNTETKCSGVGDKYNPLQRKFVFIGGGCYMEDKADIPETMIVEYAPWLTDAESEARGFVRERPYDSIELREKNDAIVRREQSAIAAIPASQWHKIVLHPAELARKLKIVDPSGKTANRCCKTIIYKIKINRDGTYVVEESQGWDYGISNSHNPWA